MTPNYPDFTSYEFWRNSGMAEILFHTFMDYPLTTPFPGVIVPQRVYRSQQTFEMRPPIRFMGRNTPGILLRNALALDFSGLAQANTIPFITGTSARIALRIIWPGYDTWSDNIHAFDHTNAVNPITLARLAHVVAKEVRRFLTDMAQAPSTETRNDWWLTNVRFEDLALIELRHVSTGSWQPVLCRIIP